MPRRLAGTKPKRGVVLGMAKEDHEVLAQRGGAIDAGPDQGGANPAALLLGSDSDRSEREHRAFVEPRTAEDHVADDATVEGCNE